MWVIWTPFIRQLLAVTTFKFICSIKSLFFSFSPQPQVPEPLEETDTRFPFENVLFDHFYSLLLFSGQQSLQMWGGERGGALLRRDQSSSVYTHTLTNYVFVIK